MTDKETIEKAKEEVAKDNGSEDWDELWFDVQDSINPREPEKVIDRVVIAALQLQREEVKKELREKIEEAIKLVEKNLTNSPKGWAFMLEGIKNELNVLLKPL